MKIIDNKVEKLRVVERTKAQVDELIGNLEDIGIFTDIEKDFLEQFKKIYHIGLKQLKKFIDKLDKEGNQLDETTILYYKQQLINGPLLKYLSNYTTDTDGRIKNYWKNNSDVIGVMGNTGKSSTSTPVWVDTALDCATDTFNKLPKFVQEVLAEQTSKTSEVFNFNFASGVQQDNTLPYIDKVPFTRCVEEYFNGYNKTSHGNYMVKDIEFYKDILTIRENIFNYIKTVLDEKHDYRLYEYIKTVNPFSDDNVSLSTNVIVERKYTSMSDKESVFATDMIGNQFESDARQAFELEIATNDKDKKFKLYTVEGQLGSGDKPKSEPIK